MLKKCFVLFFTFAFASIFMLQNAHAEEKFSAEQFPYKEMQIQVMPEFDYPENWPKDEPSLLVGYYGTIINKSGKDFSGSIEFPVPVKDRNFSVYLIAEFPEENKPEVQRPFKVDKEKGVVTWEPGKSIKKDESYRYVIEYYANPFEVKESDKKFNFEYLPKAEIETLDVIIYNPLNSKNFVLEPKAQNVTNSENSQELHQYQYKNVKPEESLNFQVTYNKDGNESALSIISKLNPPNEENLPNTSSNVNNKNAANDRPIIGLAGALIIGMSIIIAGVFVFFGMKGNTNPGYQQKSKKKNPVGNKRVLSQVQEAPDEKKKLRTMLLNGKIDQKTYEEKMKKLI